MLTKTRIALLLCGSLVLVSTGLAVIATVSAGPQLPGFVTGGSFPGWNYGVWKEQDGHMVARVSYPSESVAALQRYQAVNRALAQQLTQEGTPEFFSVVTFKAPVPVGDFRVWLSASPLKAERFTLRVMAQDGSRVTVGGAPSNGQAIDLEHLNRILEIVASHGATDVRGITSMEGTLAAADYDRVAADSRVFLVDVTRSAVLNHIAKVAPGIKIDPYSVLLDPTYPRMEDLGLAHFQ